MIAPRIRWAPAAKDSRGAMLVEFAHEIGIALDAEQQLTLELGCRIGETGKWAALEVAMNGPRQNGKNEVALVRELGSIYLFDDDLVVHSAQELKTSMEHFRRVEHVITNSPLLSKRLKPGGRSFRHANGQESVELRTGQRIRFMTRTKTGGLGHTGDLVVFDEVMVLAGAVLIALMPTLRARSIIGNPQLWYFGSAADRTRHIDCEHFSSLRRRALTGADPSLAYVEWSADIGDPALDDPDLVTDEMLFDRRFWRQANWAMGVRIAEEHMEKELRSAVESNRREAIVDLLGIGAWDNPDTESGIFDLAAWAELVIAASGARPSPVCIGLDVTEDRAFSTIAIAGWRDEKRVVQVVEHERGTQWVAPRLAEMAKKWKAQIWYDARGPASSLEADLKEAGLREYDQKTKRGELVKCATSEFAQGCGMLYDWVQQRAIWHLGQPSLDAAVKHAKRRPLASGAWMWARTGVEGDPTPLIAVTLALTGLSLAPKRASGPMVSFA